MTFAKWLRLLIGRLLLSMSLLSDCFLSNGRTVACLSSACMTAFSREALVTYVMIGTTLSTLLSLSCLVGSGSNMHVLSAMPRILEISAVVVGSNTWMDAVKQGVCVLMRLFLCVYLCVYLCVCLCVCVYACVRVCMR